MASEDGTGRDVETAGLFFPHFPSLKRRQRRRRIRGDSRGKNGTMPVISLLADRAELPLRSRVFIVYFPCPRCGEFDG